MKTCAKCKECKEQDQFPYKNRKKGMKQSYCFPCMREFTREDYRRKSAEYKARSKKHRLLTKEMVKDEKCKPCADCGVTYPFYVMDYDHRPDENKSFNLSEAQRGKGRTQVLEEIAKCDIVCSNCHRERTYQRLLNNRDVA